jgi:hypothetical protein
MPPVRRKTMGTFPNGTRVRVHFYGRNYPGVVVSQGRKYPRVRFRIKSGKEYIRAAFVVPLPDDFDALCDPMPRLPNEYPSGTVLCSECRVIPCTRKGD